MGGRQLEISRTLYEICELTEMAPHSIFGIHVTFGEAGLLQRAWLLWLLNKIGLDII